ncbi:MAG: DUF3667 domain-containing protein [Holophaga sp.]|nr:DUF3667 domain-containing protein [Holophaga sp.]
MKHLFHTVMHELLHVDGRVWRTLRLLLLKPGQVALEYLEGKRTTYIPPFRLFLVVSLVILLLLQASVYDLNSIVAQVPVFKKALAWGAEQAGMRVDTYFAQCNARFQGILRINFLYVDTSVTILLAALLWRRQRPAIGAHAVFFLYTNTVVALGSSLLVWLGSRLVPGKWNFLFGAATILFSVVYMSLGIRRYYGQSRGWTLLKVAIVILVSMFFNLLAFLAALLISLPILKYAAVRGV